MYINTDRGCLFVALGNHNSVKSPKFQFRWQSKAKREPKRFEIYK